MTRRIFLVLAGLQLVFAASTIPFYRAVGLSFDWVAAFPTTNLTLLLGLLAFFSIASKLCPTWHFPDVLLVLLLLVTLLFIATPAQYLAVAFHRPLVDSTLASADAVLGLNVRALTAWTTAHPMLVRLLMRAYFTLAWQFWVPIALLGLRRDRDGLWEYAFHFHVCLLTTVVTSMVWPVAGVFTQEGFTSLLDQAPFIQQFDSLRAGTFHLIRMDDLQGLISMPSFHVAGALFVTWACRGTRVVFYPLVLLNALLIASTVLMGAHYGVDIVASACLVCVSVACYRLLVGQFVFVRRSAVIDWQLSGPVT